MIKAVKIKELHQCNEIELKYGKKFLNTDAVKDGIYPVITSASASPYNHNKYNQEEPCITISMSGTPGIILFHGGPIWAGNCIVITSKKHNIKYIYYALKQQESKIKSLQSGGVIPHIYINNIEQIAITLPSLSEQDRVVKLLDKLEEKVENLQQLTTNYDAFKKGWMQKLFN